VERHPVDAYVVSAEDPAGRALVLGIAGAAPYCGWPARRTL
jgi:hypothetical protein